MEPFDLFILVSAGLVGGVCNAVAGGGTFFTFPALLAMGVPPVAANATSAMSILPGHATSLLGYRPELRRQAGRLKASAPAFIVGAIVGVGLLLATGDARFRQFVPYLIFMATLLFAAGPWVRLMIKNIHLGAVPKSFVFVIDFTIAVYGGYFGAGLGILLIAILTLVGLDEFGEANAVKNALATIVSIVAVSVFIATGAIAWGPGSVVLLGAIAGGYLGAKLASRVNPGMLRAIVIAVGLLLTGHYL